MKPCPRCGRANAIARESDRWGEYDSCWTCGYHQDVMDGPALEWTPWNPRREFNDPIIGAEKIAKAKRWRNPERRREYQRAYKARRKGAT